MTQNASFCSAVDISHTFLLDLLLLVLARLQCSFFPAAAAAAAAACM